MFQCFSVSVLQCFSASCVSVLQCFSASVFQCFSVSVLQCFSASVFQCFSVSSASVSQCFSKPVLQYASVSVFHQRLSHLRTSHTSHLPLFQLFQHFSFSAFCFQFQVSSLIPPSAAVGWSMVGWSIVLLSSFSIQPADHADHTEEGSISAFCFLLFASAFRSHPHPSLSPPSDMSYGRIVP